MPSFNIGGPPTQIFAVAASPITTPANTVQVFNSGSSPVFIGGNAVSPGTGMQLQPGQHFRLSNMFNNLFACGTSAASATSTVVGVGATATAGTTKWTVTSAAGISAGTVILVGAASNPSAQEVLSVASVASTVLTTATGALFTHVAGDTVAVAVVTGAQVNVIPGIL